MYLLWQVRNQLLYSVQFSLFDSLSKNSNFEVEDEDNGTNDDGGDDDPGGNGSGDSGGNNQSMDNDNKDGKRLIVKHT